MHLNINIEMVALLSFIFHFMISSFLKCEKFKYLFAKSVVSKTYKTLLIDKKLSLIFGTFHMRSFRALTIKFPNHLNIWSTCSPNV